RSSPRGAFGCGRTWRLFMGRRPLLNALPRRTPVVVTRRTITCGSSRKSGRVGRQPLAGHRLITAGWARGHAQLHSDRSVVAGTRRRAGRPFGLASGFELRLAAVLAHRVVERLDLVEDLIGGGLRLFLRRVLDDLEA